MTQKLENIILTLDSSMTMASVGLGHNGQLIDSIVLKRQKSHSEQMNKAIQDILSRQNIKFSDLSAVAVTEGPGSFTGLRIAGNIAKTICYTLNSPMVVLNTLVLLQNQIIKLSNDEIENYFDFQIQGSFSSLSIGSQSTSANFIVCSMINAFKQMVFISLAHKNGTQILEPSLMTLQEASSLLKNQKDLCFIIGDGFDYYEMDWDRELLSKLRNLILRPKVEYKIELDYPKVQQIIEDSFNKLKKCHTIEWKQFLPLYLKHSEAEENLRLGKLKFRNLGDY